MLISLRWLCSRFIEMTNNLERRIFEHHLKQVKGFRSKYNVKKFVYYEETDNVNVAISREKEIKKWRRAKKNSLVIEANPEWRDLSEGWF